MKQDKRGGVCPGCRDTDFSYKNLDLLAKHLNPQNKLLSRRRTGFCAKCQRKLKRSVKVARTMALLPFGG